MPRKTMLEARVAINELIWTMLTSTPLTMPRTAPIRMPAAIPDPRRGDQRQLAGGDRGDGKDGPHREVEDPGDDADGDAAGDDPDRSRLVENVEQIALGQEPVSGQAQGDKEREEAEDDTVGANVGALQEPSASRWRRLDLPHAAAHPILPNALAHRSHDPPSPTPGEPEEGEFMDASWRIDQSST